MKRWIKYVKPYWPFFILGPLCMIVEVIGEVLMPKLLSYIIDFGIYEGKEGKEIPAVIAKLYEVCGQNAFVAAIAAGMIITALLMMIGGVGGAWFGGKASVNFASDLREDVYRKIQTFSFSEIDKFSTGSLVTRMTNDVTQLQNFVNMMLRMFFRAPGMMIGALIMAISLNPDLSVVLAVSIPVLLISVAFIIVKGFPLFSKMQTKIDRLNITVGENLRNVRVVKSFVREEYEKEKFARANGDLHTSTENAMKVMILLSPVMTFVMNATSLAVFWFGGNMLLDGKMTTGDLTAFVTYITQILSSLMMVTMLFMVFSRALASGKRLAEVLDEETDIPDTAANSPLTVLEGAVEFRHVNFRYYKTSDEKVLDDVNLLIEPGETVGIIGSTGCGKTTLVSMIARLYDPDEGTVLVDGRDVREYSLFHLREGVGMVLQKNVLFSGTVEDNLRWGDENATDEEIAEASRAAQADIFISEMKEGYRSPLDAGGTNVSGGQKQRLCIARALLKKPKILILDDSTSAVDTATEARIREHLRERMKGTTTVIIAQRISSVRDADKIVVMNDGRITAIGGHDQLLAECTEYREIYESQTGEEEGKKNVSENA